MDEKPVEKDAIDIECLDTIDSSDVIVLTDETVREVDSDSSISGNRKLRTGNILAQFFNVIAQIREKEFWQLNNSEINSLNNTCPKILPKVLAEHSGIIGCVLSLLSIIVKRIKLEKELPKDTITEITEDQTEVSEGESLTGGRND